MGEVAVEDDVEVVVELVVGGGIKVFEIVFVGV